ncbi:MAG: aspartate aminotransferase family protein [Candidatus Parvarchaeota archaeon]
MTYSTSESKRLYELAKSVFPGGVNGKIKYREPYPLFLSRASGSHVWDADDNEYIDYNLSYGALILGHGHPIVKETIIKVLETTGTTLFGNPNKLEIELAELLLGIYMKDGYARFTNSGLEATLLAIRLARAFTKKSKIGKFDGHYHGANPFLLANYRPTKIDTKTGKIEKEADSADVTDDLLDNIVVIPFNDIENTKRILDENDVGAVILEPFEDGYIEADKDFMIFLRNYTRERGIVLIFDEVKTGFRIRLGGAVEYYGIVPDIICLGKVIGGGAPIGAVIGKREIMDLLNPRNDVNRQVFHSGTFNGNPISMSLGIATINLLKDNDNFERIRKLSNELRQQISIVLNESEIDHVVYGEGGIVNYTIGRKRVKTYRDLLKSDLNFRKKIDNEMLKRGVYLVPGSRFSLSISHTSYDIDKTIESLEESLKNINQIKE